MSIKEDLDFFNNNLRIKLNKLISEETCKELILKYKDFERENPIDVTSKKLIKECAPMIFNDKLDDFLKSHFQTNYHIIWASFEMVDSTAPKHNCSTKWHLDGGAIGSLKLFIYLNPVSEHGGNTIMVDEKRTEKLRKANKLPLQQEQREEDITSTLKELGLNTEHIEYELQSGEALLFSPLLLAHKCLAPKKNKKRYTICFTIIPI